MKHNAKPEDEFINYAPAMPNLSRDSGLLGRIAGLFVRDE